MVIQTRGTIFPGLAKGIYLREGFRRSDAGERSFDCAAAYG